jgi:uncharacterized protein YbjT (DUF2867 family)
MTRTGSDDEDHRHGATGLIGTRLVAALRERGDEVTGLSRHPEDARRLLGVDAVG